MVIAAKMTWNCGVGLWPKLARVECQVRRPKLNRGDLSHAALLFNPSKSRSRAILRDLVGKGQRFGQHDIATLDSPPQTGKRASTRDGFLKL
jgi:hypothetical protein